MKKYMQYFGILAIGLTLGWLIFGNQSNDQTTHDHEISATEYQQWTCSMHPQILQPEAGDCPICGMDLIPAETSAGGLDVNEFKMTENATALANIETTIISANTHKSAGFILTGKIAVNEKTNAIQTAHFGGRIEKMYVNSVGENINKGQLLALIYSPELVTTQKELLTAARTKKTDPPLYNAVKNKLKLWKLSARQIQEIENSKEVITNFPVYANVNGVVAIKMVDEGNYVKKGQGLFMISNLNTVWANFDVYEKQISRIKKGDQITITSNADPLKEIQAKISFIDPVLNTATRTVIVRAVLLNSKGALKPGMFVKGVLTSTKFGDTNKTLISVPKTAILWTGNRSVVYVKKQGTEPIFEMRNITLGNEIGDAYEILEGLSENEEIVTNGTFTVDAAAQLQGKKSMMNATSRKLQTGHKNHGGIQEMNADKEPTKVKRIEVSPIFQKQLKEVFSGYLLVKDALVNDDSTKANEYAGNLNQHLKKVDMKLLTKSESHNLWMKFQKEINNSSKEISMSTDIETQRAHFIVLSNNISNSLESFGINQKIYKQFCPMANSDKGAIWLSTEKNIMNPYFGASMLRCGNIESVID